MNNKKTVSSATHARKIPIELIVALVIIFTLGMAAFIKLREMRQIARRASCANDLRQLWLYLAPYAERYSGHYPAISATRGNIMMDPTGLYPDIMKSSAWVQCEWSEARNHPDRPDESDLGPDAFNDESFFYLPWELHNEAEGLAFIEAYKTMNLATRDDPLPVTINGENHLLPRAKMRARDSNDTDLPATLPTPLLVEWPTKEHADMCVLYTDGSVHCMKMGQEFPMTEALFMGMREIADMDGSIAQRSSQER